MKDFVRFLKSYTQADSSLQQKWAGAKSRKSRDEWERLCELNDHAYFMVMFAQIEDLINTKFKKAVERSRQGRSKFGRGMALSVELDNLERVSFLNRVACLIDKGGATYRDIKELKGKRDDIAHGDTNVTGIVIATMAQKIKQLAGEFR